MKRSAFTLIELIIVIAIIALIVTAVVAVLDPVRRINASRNTKRRGDSEALVKALILRVSQDDADLPAVINENTWTMIGTATLPAQCAQPCGTAATVACVDLTPELVVPKHLTELPKNPGGGTDAVTMYAVKYDGGGITVRSCLSDQEEKNQPPPLIEVTR